MNKLLMLMLLSFIAGCSSTEYQVGDCITMSGGPTLKITKKGKYSYMVIALTGQNIGTKYQISYDSLEELFSARIDCFEEEVK